MNTTMCYVLAYFIEALILYYYSVHLFTEKNHSICFQAAVLSIGYLTIFAFSRLNNYILNTASFVIISGIIIYILFDVSVLKCIFHTLILSAVMGLCEVIPLNTIIHFAYDFYAVISSAGNLLIFLIISKLLYFLVSIILVHIFKSVKENNDYQDKGLIFLTFVPLSSLFIMITFVVVCVSVQLNQRINFLISTSSILLVFINIVVFAFYKYNQQKNRNMTELELRLQHEHDLYEYNKMLNIQDENQRILVHDIRKHLNTITTFALQEKYERIVPYIDSMTKSSMLNSSVRVSDNDILNSIIYRYQNICHEKHVNFKTDIRSKCLDFVSDTDMTSLFCNLLDNAVQATSFINNAFIELSVSRKSNSNFILISLINSCSVNPFVFEKGQKVLKKKRGSSHGIGILSIKKTIQTYNGNINMYYDESTCTFHTIITLKN